MCRLLFPALFCILSFAPQALALRVLPNDSVRRSSERYSEEHRRLFEQRSTALPVTTHPDEHLVNNLPLLDSFPTQQWAGLLPASSHDDKYFFYWLFAPDNQQNQKPESEIPLLIWLNGGPACSSMDGLFLENGPFRFVVNAATREYKLQPDEAYSWHKLPAYTLYIDQPVGTGLSYTTSKKYPTNDGELCTDFYYFLQAFLKLHSDKFVISTNGRPEMNRDLYFSGESYAGHYNIIYANHILQQNTQPDNIRIRIKGAAIGNGWVDPYYQYAGAEAAYGHGLIGMSEVAAFQEKEIQCQRNLEQEKFSTGICFDLVDDIVSQSFGKGSKYKISSYDIRRVEGPGLAKFPPGHTIVEGYLGHWSLTGEEGTLPDDITPRAIQALHAEASVASGQRYKECTDPPYLALAKLDGKGVVPEIVQVLEHPDQVQVLFFNGIQDMVCNHVGNERSLEKLPWKHADDWNAAPRYAWSAVAPTQVSGYMREYQNLKYLKILDAGHMVPLDVPAVAFAMMQTFLYGGSFQNSQQVLDRTKSAECPVCPQCPVYSNSDENNENRGTWSPLVLLIAATIVAGFLLFVVLHRKKAAVEHRVTIPQHHGLELQESRYTDEPENEDANESPTRVI
ncbi:carboxypeptidase D [Fistulifera solaris]|uniref:Carboxypeptidase D n=1 Tax=Fistulifera solaris TaxID=1519565 RepID=A0A1Z5K241_FISSO|nr:carboxypeptidase D [Fistulifera solaris]|eukprot:GAX20239.1 carboxypeptidase D [Fistulifera solaris]